MMSKKGRRSGGDKPGRSKKDRTDSEESDVEMEDTDTHATWDCPVCTFKNRFEAFKCEMCDTRKGTSTRKPRLNMNVVQQQQILVQSLALNEGKVQKRTRAQAGTPDSPQSLSVSTKRESSSSSFTHPTEAASPNSASGKEGEKEPPSHKREKIRDSLVLRDPSKKYEITDSDGSSVTIVALKSRQLEKELQLVNALRLFDNYSIARREKVERARMQYEEEKRKLEEDRQKQRLERENRPKRPKKIKVKKVKKPLIVPRGRFQTSSKTSRPAPRGRPPNKNKVLPPRKKK